VATTTSTANVDLVKSLGADIVIDYKKEDFEKTLRDYDVVLNSLGKETLEKSLQVLKPGGKLISISGPPDADFAMGIGSSWVLRQLMRLLSHRIRRKARRRGVGYSFLFMKANGDQLRNIASLVDSKIMRPVVDRVFPFAETKRRWPTSKLDGQKARSSSRSKGNVSTSQAADVGQVPGRLTRPNQVLAIVCAGVVLANLDLFIVNVAMPEIARGFRRPGGRPCLAHDLPSRLATGETSTPSRC
jgi:hypothetical protein